jgi:hypothetical protein
LLKVGEKPGKLLLPHGRSSDYKSETYQYTLTLALGCRLAILPQRT